MRKRLFHGMKYFVNYKSFNYLKSAPPLKYLNIGSGLFIVLLVSIIGAFWYFQKENQKINQEVSIRLNDLEEKRKTLKQATELRVGFIKKLCCDHNHNKEEIRERSKRVEELKPLLEKISKINFLKQEEFDLFEQLNAHINRIIVSEINFMKNSKNKPKNFFKNESDLRIMERYDLNLDKAREKYSQEAFQIAQLISKTNSYFRLNSGLKSDVNSGLNSELNLDLIKAGLSVFKVDELILQAKSSGMAFPAKH